MAKEVWFAALCSFYVLLNYYLPQGSDPPFWPVGYLSLPQLPQTVKGLQRVSKCSLFETTSVENCYFFPVIQGMIGYIGEKRVSAPVSEKADHVSKGGQCLLVCSGAGLAICGAGQDLFVSS